MRGACHFLVPLVIVAYVIIIMARRYRRRFRSRGRYSHESTTITTPVVSDWAPIQSPGENLSGTNQVSFSIVPPTEVQGVRTIGHFTLSFSSTASNRVAYALVYVPEGYENNAIHLPIPGFAASLYEPSQFVISSGMLDFDGGPLRVRSPLKRRLNQNDRIVLIFASTDTSAGSIIGNISYSIKY